MSFDNLLSPFSIGRLAVRNRIVMPPMVIWASDQSGEVRDAHLKHYAARRGPGLIIVEATAVAPEGRLAATQLGIFDAHQVTGLSHLAEVIQRGGAVPGIQLHHAGGKATLETTYGRTPLVPSKCALPADKVCTELSTDDIRRIIDAFVSGARRAVRAGFGLIELHGAHGYLACQFLSPRTNQRSDDYGGSPQQRRRFLAELFQAVQAEVGDAATVIYRLGVAEENGLTIEDGIATASALAALGMPLVHVSSAHEPPASLPLRDPRFSPLMNLGIRVHAATELPTIGVGGIIQPAQAETLLAEGLVDLVAVGKGLLADPAWVRKIAEGRAQTIKACIGCKPCRCFKDPALCPMLPGQGRA
jgi:2,4-dienoyl-CoA reductase-like NADH-dependent reductase (Old Yellow Enzyme family)